MTCSTCGTANPPNGRFCLECGGALGGCPACGVVNPPTAKFCGSCGGPLAGMVEAARGRSDADGPEQGSGAAPGTGSAKATERRMVTVLFADLVGFTTLSSTRDPETVREIQDRYFERTREIIGRYGGMVEKFIGDAVMAMWGAPTAHEDDAERAVRAGLDLAEAIPSLGTESDVELQLRVGILTGEAAVSMGAEDQGMVTGDMVNTAARLQSVAAPGTVLVGDATRLAAGPAIVFEAAGDQDLKGKAAPVAAWRAVRVVSERGGVRRPDALEPPFVGRADELRFLKEQFHATGREGKARLVSLVGQAGIGKSRLAWELEKYLDGVVEPVWWHRGRSPSYGEGVTFWALGEMIRRRAGLAEGDDEQTTRRAVSDMVDRFVADEAERAMIKPRILVLLGTGDAVAGGRAELFAAWRTFFERLAESGTVAFVVEDLQWSDDGLLDFLEHLLDWGRSSPILVLTLARPELLERRPGWGTDRRGAMAMRLDPLGDDAMRELLAGIAPELPGGILGKIVARADGIPLYAVETIRMLVATGRLLPDGERLVPTADLEATDLAKLEVPPTLHALVAARLDALPAADRDLLQGAAVLGQSFTLDALAAMTGETAAALGPRLASLVRLEVLTVETDQRAPTRGQHAFVQALLREVAYSTLARRERRARHLTAARFFESLADDEVAGVVASHFVAAYRSAPDGPESEAIAGQARIALIATARRAQALGALGQAIDALRTAQEVAREPADRAALQQQVGWLQTLDAQYDAAHESLVTAEAAYAALGDRIGVIRTVAKRVQAHLASGRIAAAVEAAEPTRDEAEALVAAAVRGETMLGSDAAEVAADYAEALGRTAFRSKAMADAIRWSDQALGLADPLGLDEILLMAMITKASAMAFGRRRREGRALLEGAVLDARASGQHEVALRGVLNLSGTTAESDPKVALEWTREGLALTRRLGLRGYDSYFAGNIAGAAERMGEWAWGRDAIGAMLEMDPDRFDAPWLTSCRDAATAWMGAPDVEHAERILENALAEQEFQTELNISAWLARCDFAGGRPADALQRSETFFQHAEPGEGLADFGMIGRFALHASRIADAERVLDLVGIGPGGIGSLDVTTIRAGLAALEGRTGDAIGLYRTAVSGYREYGARFDLALTILDMATFIDPVEAVVRTLIPEARQILGELGALPLLERLDVLVEKATGSPGLHEVSTSSPLTPVETGGTGS